MKVTVITSAVSALGTVPKVIRDQIKASDYRKSSIVNIGWNTEKSPEDQRRFAIIHNLVKNLSPITGLKNSQDLRKGYLKRETESFLIEAENIAIKTNFVKTKNDKSQQNSKCGDRDEMINHIINESSKLAP